MAQGTISKEKIDETFANRFKDTFKDIIEERRFQNSQLSADGKPVGKKCGCTHKELAMEAGVNEKTFHSYISSQNKSKRLDIVAQIAYHFNISVDYLLGFTNVQELRFDGVSTADVRKISEYTGLSSKAIEQLHKYAGAGNLTMTQTVNQLLEELADNHSMKEFEALHPLDEEYMAWEQQMAEEGPPETPEQTDEELVRSYQEFQEDINSGVEDALASVTSKVFTRDKVLQLIDAYLHLKIDRTQTYIISDKGVILNMNDMIEADVRGFSEIQMQLPASEVAEQALLDQIKDELKYLKHGEPKWRISF